MQSDGDSKTNAFGAIVQTLQAGGTMEEQKRDSEARRDASDGMRSDATQCLAEDSGQPEFESCPPAALVAVNTTLRAKPHGPSANFDRLPPVLALPFLFVHQPAGRSGDGKPWGRGLCDERREEAE